MNSSSRKSPRAGTDRKSENNFAIFELLEDRLLLAASPTFGTDLGDYYWLNTDGSGLTLGIDGEDIDGDILDVSISASDATGLSWEIHDADTDTNRYAVMHFYEADGVTPIGDIVVQLFEHRAPLMAERFITLSTKYVDPETGDISDPTVDNPAFYTNVDVHRIMDEFMFQTGDATDGDGTGSSALDDLDTEVDDHLSYSNGGVLGAANAGAGTTNNQWFLTEIQTPWLDGGYTIFGQIISGWDVYEQIISTETLDGEEPAYKPVLGSVDITDSPQDATVTIWADENFTGPVDITITLDDGNGGTVDHTITVMPQADISDAVSDTELIDAGQTTIIDLDMDFNGDTGVPFYIQHNYDGPGTMTIDLVYNVDTWQLQIEAPAEYDNSDFYIGFAIDYANRFSNETDLTDLTNGTWFEILAVPYLKMEAIADMDDVAPGQTLTVVLNIDVHDSDLENDLILGSSNTYDNGGTFEEPEIFFDNGQWKMTFTVPDEYDGEGFDITASVVRKTEAGETAPVSQTFSVKFGERPTIEEPDTQTIAPGDTLELDLSIDDDVATEFTLTASSPNSDVVVSVDSDTKKLTIKAPESYYGSFTVIVTAIEKDLGASYPSLATTAIVFSVEYGLSMDEIPDITDLEPDADEDKTIVLPINFSGDLNDLDVIVTHNYNNGGSLPDPVVSIANIDGEDVWTVTIAAPANYNGEAFDLTISVTPKNYEDFPQVSQTISVYFGTRPQITNQAVEIPDTADTTIINLGITGGIGNEFDITAICNHPAVDVEIVEDNGVYQLKITTSAAIDEIITVDLTIIEKDYGTTYPALPISHSTIELRTIGLNDIAEFNDIDFEDIKPGQSAVIYLPIDYAGDIKNDVQIWTTTTYDSGGSVNRDVTYKNGQARLNLEIPSQYDGQAFEITVFVRLIDTTASVPYQQTISFKLDERPVLTLSEGQELRQSIVAGQETELNFQAQDASVNLIYAATADNENVTVDVTQDGKLTISTADLWTGEFTVTITAVEKKYANKYSNIKPAELEIKFESYYNDTVLLNCDKAEITDTEIITETIVEIYYLDDLVEAGGAIEPVTVSNDYGNDNIVTTEITHISGSYYKITTRISTLEHEGVNFSGEDFTITYAANYTDDIQLLHNIAITTAHRPIITPGFDLPDDLEPGEINEIPVNISSLHGSDITVVIDNISTGGIVTNDKITFDAANNIIVIDLTDYPGFAGDISFDAYAYETNWEDFAQAAATKQSFSFSNSSPELQFENDLDENEYLLSDDGYGLTIPVDALMGDGTEAVKITVTSSSNKLQFYTTHGNPIAHLEFSDADGNHIGTISIELFEDRFGSDDPVDLVNRFITLAQNQIYRTMYDNSGNQPGYKPINEDNEAEENLDFDTPYYTDLPLFSITTGHLFITGEPAAEDGTGRSGLEYLDNYFGPKPYTDRATGFAGLGTVGMYRQANATDEDENEKSTTDDKFFICGQPMNQFNGEFAAFGQVISGMDVLEYILAERSFTSTQDNQPILTNVTVDKTNCQDGSVTIVPKKGFKGSAEITISIDDDDESTQASPVSQTITVHQAKRTPDAPELSIVSGVTVDSDNYIYAAPGTQRTIILDTGEETDEPLKLWVQVRDLNNNIIISDVTAQQNDPQDDDDDNTGYHEFTVFIPQSYDGSDILIEIFARSGKYENAPVALESILLTAENSQSISVTMDGGRVSSSHEVDSDDVDSELYELSINDDLAYVFEASVDQDAANAGVDVTIFEDAGGQSYLKIDFNNYEGIIKLTITARQDIYGNSSLLAAERNIYISTYSTNGEGVEVDDSENHTPELVYLQTGDENGVEIDFYTNFSDGDPSDFGFIGDGSKLRFEVESDSFKVVSSIVSNGDGSARINLLIPKTFYGVFEVTVSVYYDSDFGEDFGPETYTITVITPNTYDDSVDADKAPVMIPESIFDQDRRVNVDEVLFDLSDFNYIADIKIDGNLLFVLDRQQGLAAFDNTDPTAPVLLDYFNNSGFTSVWSYSMELVSKGDQNFILVAAGSNGLLSIEYTVDDENNVTFAENAVAADTSSSGLNLGSTLIVYDIEIVKNTAYLASGSNGLVLCDIANPAEPVCIDDLSALLPSDSQWRKFGHNRRSSKLWTYIYRDVRDVESRNGCLYVAESVGGMAVSAHDFETLVDKSTQGWVAIYDLTKDINDPQKKGMIKFREGVKDMLVEAQTLYIAAETSVKTLSIGDPEKPIAKGLFETQGDIQCLSTYFRTLVVTTRDGFEFFDNTQKNNITKTGIIEVNSSDWVIDTLLSGEIFYDHKVFTVDQYAYLSVPVSGIMMAIKNTPTSTINSGDKLTIELAGEPVTLSISGGGKMEVDFSDDGSGIDLIKVTDATAKTTVNITTHKNNTVIIKNIEVYGADTDPDDGEDIYFDGDINQIIAPQAILTGDLTVSGTIRKLVLAGVGITNDTTEQEIELGGDANSKPSVLSLGKINDVSITSSAPIAKFVTSGWVDTENDVIDILTAPEVKILKVASSDASFQAGLDISGSLTSALIKGDVSDAVWQIGGLTKSVVVTGQADNFDLLAADNITKLSFGQLTNSNIYAGYIAANPPANNDLPGAATGIFDITKSIGSITIKGAKDSSGWLRSFIDSSIGAGQIGKAVIVNPKFDNDDEDAGTDDSFGLISTQIDKLKIVDKEDRANNYLRKNISASDAALAPLLDDLYIRIV